MEEEIIAEVTEHIPVMTENEAPEDKTDTEEVAVTKETENKHIVKYPGEKKIEKRPLSMHAIKCKCGDILSRKMEHCPGCGKSIEVLLEELRQDFYRINFKQNPKKGK
ncbi:MAG: hypothetical protein AB1796_08770 [Bacillota bacterium]